MGDDIVINSRIQLTKVDDVDDLDNIRDDFRAMVEDWAIDCDMILSFDRATVVVTEEG